MYYETGGHRAAGLSFDPFKALVAPRPIGWISAVDGQGRVNLSPYSYFNAISGRPPMVMFSSEGKKDAISFVEETREFVCNIVGEEMFDQMSLTSAPLPRGTSEFGHAGLESIPSTLVRPPRVKGVPAALECRLISLAAIPDLDGNATDRHMAIGQVVAFHIDDRYVRDGIVDIALFRPVARCGYKDYAVVRELIALDRPEGGGQPAR
jgi:flavin reductase (DIM6/NTAB) family NADH-FMN oxidoreductase RutF